MYQRDHLEILHHRYQSHAPRPEQHQKPHAQQHHPQQHQPRADPFLRDEAVSLLRAAPYAELSGASCEPCLHKLPCVQTISNKLKVSNTTIKHKS